MKRFAFLVVGVVVVVGLVGLWAVEGYADAPVIQGTVFRDGNPVSGYKIMCFSYPVGEWLWNEFSGYQGYWASNNPMEVGEWYKIWACNGSWKGYRIIQYTGPGMWVEINADTPGTCPPINR